MAIIDRETYEAAQERRKRNMELSRRNQKYPYLLSGFFRCNECGNAMTGSSYTTQEKRVHVYRCGKQWARPEQEPCPHRNATISSHIAESKVWSWIVNLWSDEDGINEGILGYQQRSEAELEPKKRRLLQLKSLAETQEKRAARLISQMSDDDDPAISVMIKEQAKKELEVKKDILSEIQQLEQELTGVEITPEMIEQMRRTIEMVRDGIKDPSYEVKRTIFNWLNVNVLWRVDETGRWLDMNCELHPEKASIMLCRSQVGL